MNFIYYKGNQKVDEPQPLKVLQVYDNHNDEIDKKILDFWVKEQALPSFEEEFIKERVSEVLYIILNDIDEIVGVSSGVSMYYHPIRNNFLYFRLFVQEKYRGNNQGVAITLYYSSFDLFNELKSFKSKEVVGLLIIYESEHLNKVINYYHSELYRNQFFLGFDDKMQQIRISYFNGAKMF